MERSFEYSESIRRQASSIIFGEISEVLSGGWYRVTTDDGLKTGKVPGLRPNGEGTIFFAPMALGEQVLLLVPNGDLSLAVIAGSIPRRALLNDKPLTQGEWSFADGSLISYDTATKEMKIKAAAGAKVKIEAEGGEVSIKSLRVSIEAADVQVNGAMTVTGAISATGGIKGDGGLQIKGKVSADSIESKGTITGKEVTAGGVSLSKHVHAGVQGGSSSTAIPTAGG